MSTSKTEKPGDSYVQSFARGLSVIRSFNAEHPEQTLTQVAQETGLTRAGARRILHTLEKLGYVRLEGRLFQLTPKILDLGFSYLSATPFWKLAQPIVEELATKVGESCSMSVLDGVDAVYVLRIPTRKIISINLSIGSRLPAFCTSMGRVLLAGLSDAEIDDILAASDLHAYTPYTITDPALLKESILACRARGWASLVKELDEGLISVAAPIKNSQNHTIAAMNISGHALGTSREDFLDKCLEPLLGATKHISAMIV